MKKISFFIFFPLSAIMQFHTKAFICISSGCDQCLQAQSVFRLENSAARVMGIKIYGWQICSNSWKLIAKQPDDHSFFCCLVTG